MAAALASGMTGAGWGALNFSAAYPFTIKGLHFKVMV